jgi:hypothetical protein
MRYSLIALTMLLLWSFEANAASEEHRQLGTHEHGSGQLNVAVEGNSLALDLELPAMNVVGFEHPAGNDQEREQIKQAAELLRDGASLFKPSPAAQCTLSSVQLESVLLDNSMNSEDPAAHDGEQHADFDVSYEFQCSEPSRLRAVSFTLFQRLPGLHKLHAQVSTSRGQTGGELSEADNLLGLQ